MKTAEITKTKQVVIPAPNFQTAEFRIIGTAPLVINRMSQKAMIQMKEKQEKGSTAKKETKVREAKDFKALYEGAKHLDKHGWCGIAASGFRKAAISACRTVGFAMTLGKLSIFVEADGYDKDDGTPLVKITKGEPRYTEMPVRNDSGVIDIRPRPMWDAGWEAVVRMRFDADQFTLSDITNLLMRVGLQVGIGEGRADSPDSCGMGWGHFKLAEE